MKGGGWSSFVAKMPMTDSPRFRTRTGQLERTEVAQRLATRFHRQIGREIHLRVAEALERLAKPVPACAAHAAHVIKIELDGNDLARLAGPIDELAARAADAGLAETQSPCCV